MSKSQVLDDHGQDRDDALGLALVAALAREAGVRRLRVIER